MLRNKKKLDLADVIIYLYDSSDANSFSYVANMRVRTVLPGFVVQGLMIYRL